jgi:hypothetical protein
LVVDDINRLNFTLLHLLFEHNRCYHYLHKYVIVIFYSFRSQRNIVQRELQMKIFDGLSATWKSNWWCFNVFLWDGRTYKERDDSFVKTLVWICHGFLLEANCHYVNVKWTDCKICYCQLLQIDRCGAPSLEHNRGEHNSKV